MKTTTEKLAEIKERYEIGDKLSASLEIKIIGTKYITCQSIMDYTHDVKYTIDEFFENYM